MAVSAFKSTTKRVCSIGVGNEAESPSIAVPFQPSTPFNKRSLRRTRSFSDFSSRYLSDSASVTGGDANSAHLDSLFRQGRVSSRYQSDDSESDADSMYSRHTYRSRQNAEIGASRKAALQQSGKLKGATTQNNLRRSSSTVGGQSYKEIADFLSCIDCPSDAESGLFPRSSSRGRRADFQSDTESVFSRLTRPRQFAELGPPRAGAVQNGKAKGTRASALRRSTSVSGGSFRSHYDLSESETASYSRPTSRSRQNADFGASRMVAAAARKKGTRQAQLRRSMSQVDISDSSSSVCGFRPPSSHQDDSDSPPEPFYEMDLDLRTGDDDTSSDHPEEEKTIRAVHTQNKEPRAEELDATSLYDAMRVEMRKAVLEIRSEIEQKSATKEFALEAPSLEENLGCDAPREDDNNDATVSEVRREYAAKLEQSEKRAQDLWTQLAAEERRCLDLVKFVKEFLPPQPGPGLTLQAPPPPQGPEVEKQLVSLCLDADAQRYFDECVSISGLDIMSVNDASSCGAGYQESESPAWSVKDMSFSPRKKDFRHTNERKTAVLEPLITFCAEIEQNGKCTSKSSSLFARTTLNDDGLVLPWLQWETGLDLSFQEQSHVKDGSMAGSLVASSSRSSSGNQSLTWRESSQASKDEEEHQYMDFPPGVSGLGCLSNGDLSCWKNIEFGHLSNVGSTHDRGGHDNRFDVEMFVLQRMWMRHRIKDGRILICGGIRY